MAFVAHRNPNTSPSFLRSAPVPGGFSPHEPSPAPLAGLHRLPLRLFWSAQNDDPFDMANEESRVWAYEKVLHNGTADDVTEWVSPVELIRLWPQMQITATVYDVWQPWIDKFA